MEEFNITLPFLGFTLDMLGKVLIAVVTLRIHLKHFRHPRIKKIGIALDAWLTCIGIAMIIAGYFMRAPFEWHLTS